MSRAAIVGLLAVMLAGAARADCLDGAYAVVGRPLLSSPDGAFTRDFVTIAGDTVAIASGCPAVPAQIRATTRGTFLRAAWVSCGTIAQRVRLRVFVNKSCRTMRGRLVTRRPRDVRRFVAHHVVGCNPDDATCGACKENADCTETQYCSRPVGACSATGTCETRPLLCTRDVRPVCGCDGVTYANPCVAAAHGASIAHEGRCSDVCGGIAGVPCSDGELCELPAGECHTTDLQGKCVPLPHECPTVYQPVCGCDGVTYANDCERQAAKAQKAHDGPCTPAKCENVCDCYLTQTFPEPCPLDCATCDNYWTCDEGMCVPHCGPTPPLPICKPRICGGIAGMPCAEGEFCELPKGECHGADLQGECLPIPKICPDLYAPVCGCDGVTYSNECDRQVAGAQKAHDGACGEKCATACDCEKTSPLPDWCSLLMCPACGCAWVCDAGVCAVEVRSPPPPSACQVTDAR